MSSLLQHLKKKHTRLEQQTAALVRQCRKHSLHEWRVEVKKWRYALRMLGKIDGQFPAKQFLKPYKTLFAAAGLIREIQIQRDLLSQTEGSFSKTFLLQYRNLLQRQYNQARSDFSETARRTVLPDWKMLKKPIQCALKQCTPLAYSWYFHQLQERIAADWHNSYQLSDEALHDLRKQLKSYDAGRRLLVQTAHYDAPPLAFLPQDINAIMEQAGLWHDYATAIQRLRSDLQSGCFTDEQLTEAQRLLRRWQQKANKLKATFRRYNHR